MCLLFFFGVCVCMCTHVCVNIFYSTTAIVQFEIEDDDTSSSSFIIWESFNYSVFCMFPDEAENYPFNICEELCSNLMGIALNYIAL